MTGWALDQLPRNLPPGRRYVGWVRSPAGKVPVVPSCCRRRASVTNPATWDTFDVARASVEDGKCDGLGLVLTGDGLVAIDLDHCVEPTGILSDLAVDVLAQLPTYTEISPSGDGLHLWLFGTLPAGGRRRDALEVYDTGRFLTLTGWHLCDTSHAIVDQTVAIAAWYPQLFPALERPTPPAIPVGSPREDDTGLLAKAHQARNGDSFAALWRGDTSAYPSPSEADAALCRQLMFWTGHDLARADRLFRQSGLFRTKWDAVRGTATYGARTLGHAYATTPVAYTPPSTVLAELEELLTDTAAG